MKISSEKQDFQQEFFFFFFLVLPNQQLNGPTNLLNPGNVNLGNPNMNIPVSSTNHKINFSAQPPSIQPDNFPSTSNQNDPASDFSNNNNTSINSNNFINSSIQQRANSLSASHSLTQMNVQQINPLLSNTSNIMNPVQNVATQQALLEAQRQGNKVHSVILFDLYCSV